MDASPSKLACLGGFVRWPGNWNSHGNNIDPMILQFFFRQMSLSQKISYLHAKGVSLGSRIKNGRKLHIFMVRNLFVEVVYKNDNVNDGAEKVHVLRGLRNLNNYLEQEFRTTF